MMNIAIVTCSKYPNLIESERPLIEIFAPHNIKASPAVWNDPKVQWAVFDYLIIRTIWDYHLMPERFLKWLDQIEGLSIPMLNANSILKANQHKFYLQDLAGQGVSIVPTLFIPRTDQLNLAMVERRGWEKAVIKPAISATAHLTELFDISQLADIEQRYQPTAMSRDLLVQPFIPEIKTFGELSIIFFNKAYSHTVLKQAMPGDFRVQSDFGGTSMLFDPDPNIIQQAADILALYDEDILYARVDGVVKNDSFILMELELIEPFLFFDLYPDGLINFANSFIELSGIAN